MGFNKIGDIYGGLLNEAPPQPGPFPWPFATRAALDKIFGDGVGCAVMRQMESGLNNIGVPSWANLAKGSRILAGCFPSVTPSMQASSARPYDGAQCATQYRFTYNLQLKNFLLQGQVTSNMQGPILGFRTNPLAFSQSVQESVQYTNDGVTWQRANTDSGTSFINPPQGEPVVTAVTRVDGLPDDCGNLPGYPPQFTPSPDLPPPPNPGDVIHPETVVDIDVDFGTEIKPVTFVVGPFYFSATAGVTFNVGGQTFVLSPEGEVYAEEGVPGLKPEDLDQIEQDLQDVKDDLALDLSGATTFVDCDEFNIPVSWSGQGLLGLSNQVAQVSDAIALLVRGTCPIIEAPPQQDNESLVLDVTLTAPALLTASSALPSGTRLLLCLVDLPSTDAFTYKFASDGEPQGRFGLLFLGSGAPPDTVWIPPTHLYLKRMYIAVPSEYPSISRVRISGQPGFRYRVFDTGFRL